MRRLLARVSLGSAVCALFAGLLSHCFSPDLPACAFLCGPPEMTPRCPEDYECREDGVCHHLGSDEMCPFTVDLLEVPDLLSSPDGGDGGTADGGLADGGADAGM